jgi:hypothetical protein
MKFRHGDLRLRRAQPCATSSWRTRPMWNGSRRSIGKAAGPSSPEICKSKKRPHERAALDNIPPGFSNPTHSVVMQTVPEGRSIADDLASGGARVSSMSSEVLVAANGNVQNGRMRGYLVLAARSVLLGLGRRRPREHGGSHRRPQSEGISGDGLRPSLAAPPGEKATAGKDQTGQASADRGSGDGCHAKCRWMNGAGRCCRIGI